MFTLLAKMSYADLQKVYELTYKYGYIITEERLNAPAGHPEIANLPDAAYLEKLKIEESLAHWIDYGLEEIIQTFSMWLGEHKKDGWISGLKQVWEKDGFDKVLMNIYFWSIDAKDYIYLFVAERMGGNRGILELGDPEYLITTYGDDFLTSAFFPSLDVQERKQVQDKQTDIANEIDPQYAVQMIIEEYDLFQQLLDWIVASGWSGAELPKAGYGVNKLIEVYQEVFDEHKEAFLEGLYPLYIQRFSGLDEQIVQIEKVLVEIQRIQSSGDLEDKILGFQYGLTTAHHHGTMADYLLNVGPEKGKKILDSISEGPDREKWDLELSRILGHPLG